MDNISQDKLYKKSERKNLGAFYTPRLLADLLATILLSLIKPDKNKVYTVLDPATGDSALLSAFWVHSLTKKIKTSIIGIDVDESAINQSKDIFSNIEAYSNFIHTDGLYPYNSSNPHTGWERLKREFCPNGVDIIVSNPPWGAEKHKYKTLSYDFATAKGQFDIYDLFVESIINNLSENGYFGIIVPDSIYSIEHKEIRKLLLTSTTIKRIVRLGEGFFPDVNIAVSLIFGIKKKTKAYKIASSHLTHVDRKNILSGLIDIKAAVESRSFKVSSELMIKSDYSFLTDVKPSDIYLNDLLRKCPTIGNFISSKRGIELSKKGVVFQCENCNKWFPEPKGTLDSIVKCPHCGHKCIKNRLRIRTIISKERMINSEKLIVGESIYRYITVPQLYIIKDVCGINYKNISLYQGDKILVRKTGIGITAGIDYDNCLTNQVVYILKRKSSLNSLLTNEVILSVLNSRVITYYIIITFGSNGWKTHPYLSQADVSSLPFPNIDINNKKTQDVLKRITELVRLYSKGNSDSFPIEADLEIERNIAYLFNLGKEHYSVIMNTIASVQQMIPFKRLLGFNEEKIFNNGI